MIPRTRTTLRHYRSRLRSLSNRISLRGPYATAFNFRGLAIPYDVLDDAGGWDPAILSGHHMAREISMIWSVAKRTRLQSVVVMSDDSGLLALYLATRMFPQEAVTAVFTSPARFLSAGRLFKAFRVETAMQRVGSAGTAVSCARVRLVYVPAEKALSTLKKLPGDLLVLAASTDPGTLIEARPFAGRELALLRLPAKPSRPAPLLTEKPAPLLTEKKAPPWLVKSVQRVRLDKLSFALAADDMFVDARNSAPDLVVARRWHRRVEVY